MKWTDERRHHAACLYASALKAAKIVERDLNLPDGAADVERKVRAKMSEVLRDCGYSDEAAELEIAKVVERAKQILEAENALAEMQAEGSA